MPGDEKRFGQAAPSRRAASASLLASLNLSGV